MVSQADLFNEVHPNATFPPGAPYWLPDAGSNEKYNFRSAVKRSDEVQDVPYNKYLYKYKCKYKKYCTTSGAL